MEKAIILSENKSRVSAAIKWIPLAVVLATAFVLRLMFFTGMVRGDDLNYAHAAYALSRGLFDPNAWAGMMRIGMYFPVAALYWAFGPSEFTTLAFPFIASLLSVIFVYLIAKIVAGESAGLIAALFWAFLPLDVHLATTLLPDGPLAAFSTGSVYFFLAAEQQQGSKRYFSYIVSSLFFVWAILIKPLAIITLIYFLVVVASRFWPNIRSRFSNQTLYKKRGREFLVAGLVFVSIIVFVYFQTQSQPFIITLTRANNDLSNFLLTGDAELDFGAMDFYRSDLTIFVAPLFFVSVLMLLTQKRKETRAIILWCAVLFFYYEWGSINLNPFIYTPLQPFNEARYFLFVLAPLVILVGIYLGQKITASSARWMVPAIAFLTITVAYAEKPDLYLGQWTVWSALSSMVLVTSSIVSPGVLTNKTSAKIKQGFVGLLAAALCISMLQPFLPYHALMFKDRLDVLNAYRQTMSFWKANSEYPICSTQANSLNYASDFKLGYNWGGLDFNNGYARIVDAPFSDDQSCYFVTADPLEAVPSNWWFQLSYTSGYQTVSIFRFLNPSDAKSELAVAREAIKFNHSKENIERLYGASINALSWVDFFPSWSELHALEPDKYPLNYLSGVVSSYLQENQVLLKDSIFTNSDFSHGPDGWSNPNPEETTFFLDSVFTSQISDETTGLMQQVRLQPKQIYFFRVTISTNQELQIDVLRVDDGAIPDSFSVSEDINNPTEISVVFVTPDWGGPRNVSIELYVPSGNGRVRLQNPVLVPIPISE